MSAARTLDRLFRSNYAVIVFIGLIGWTWLLLSYNSLEHSLYRPVIRVVKDTGEVSCKVLPLFEHRISQLLLRQLRNSSTSLAVKRLLVWSIVV